MNALRDALRDSLLAVGRLAQGILDLVAVVLGNYYSFRFGAITRRLGLGRSISSSRRGFVVIQVDGVSHPHLQWAMDHGYAPTIRRLLRDEYTMAAWNPGLPCTTPAVQSALMFGSSEGIAGYRWYDKALRRPVVCSSPGVMRGVQERLRRDRQGLLEGGSSYMNMVDGGADLALFTLGAVGRQPFFSRVRGISFFALFALNPLRAVKTVWLSIWEYLTDLVQRSMARLRRDIVRPLQRAFPFMRVMANVVLREIETFCVLVDIYRGVPAIYATYYGYDEVAHHYGVVAKPAMRALSAVYTRIRQIERFLRLGLAREYDLYLLSDHGMTASVPFELAYGQTLGQTIAAIAQQRIVDARGQESVPSLQDRYFQEELAEIIDRRSRLVVAISRRLKRVIVGQRPLAPSAAPLEEAGGVVSSSGPLSHLYLHAADWQMDMDEVMRVSPNLVAELAAHPGIGLVVGRQGADVVIVGSEGVLTCGGAQSQGRRYDVQGYDPLAGLPNRPAVANDVYRLARFPESGDLLLFGAVQHETGEVVSFEKQWACHGGVGGPQNVAFLVSKTARAWDAEGITGPADLYAHLLRRHAPASD